MKSAVIGFLGLLVIGLTPAAARAQGSGSTELPGSFGSALVVTRTINGIVAAIEPKLRLIAMTDQKGKRHEFRIAPHTIFSADKKSTLAGKKELDLLDFEPGWPVRFTFTPDDKRQILLELRLRRVTP